MDILHRRKPVAAMDAAEVDTTGFVRQRIEVTVEREWITVRSRSQPQDGAEESAKAKEAPKAERPELPPPVKDRA
jgi:hypothetical protein